MTNGCLTLYQASKALGLLSWRRDITPIASASVRVMLDNPERSSFNFTPLFSVQKKANSNSFPHCTAEWRQTQDSFTHTFFSFIFLLLATAFGWYSVIGCCLVVGRGCWVNQDMGFLNWKKKIHIYMLLCIKNDLELWIMRPAVPGSVFCFLALFFFLPLGGLGAVLSWALVSATIGGSFFEGGGACSAFASACWSSTAAGQVRKEQLRCSQKHRKVNVIKWQLTIAIKTL